MLQDNSPDAVCMYEIHGKNAEKEQCCVLMRDRNLRQILRASHQRCVSSCIPLYYFLVGRTGFDFLVRFENSTCCVNAGRHVPAPAKLYLLACAGALWSVRTGTCFVALCGLISLCCAVLAALHCSGCSLSACLRCRTLVGTYLLCGCVRADCAVLCCACGIAIYY